MRNEILDVVKSKLEAQADAHRLNIEILLSNPMSIPEHTSLVEAVEAELEKLAEYLDKLEALEVMCE